MKKKPHMKKLTAYVLTAVLLIGITLMATIVASAENVVIEQSEGFVMLDHKNVGEVAGSTSLVTTWPTKGELKQSNGEYVLTSNGYAQWFDYDGLGFAYKEIYFNYGRKAKLSFEGTLTYFDGEVAQAGAGLMIRSSLQPGAATLMMHVRPEYCMATYRRTDGGESKIAQPQLNATADAIKAMFPISFKIELQAGTATYYYRPAGTEVWGKAYSVPFEYNGESVFIGLSVYSQKESHMATSKWKDFSYKVEAPEGTVPGGGGDAETPTEATVVLPPDIPISTEDVLMRETFTDGSLVEYNNPDMVETADNPIWDVKGSGYEIKTNSDQTNRYLAMEYADLETALFAGSRDWTDYRYQMDLTFTNATTLTETNDVHLYVRHTDYAHYGYENYTVSFMTYQVKGQPVRGVQISSRISGSFNGAGNVPLVQKEFDYLADLGTKHTVAIDAFDNTITVYWDGQELLSFTDWGDDSMDYLDSSNGTGYEVKTTGRVGLNANGANIEIDNIFVYKLEDPLGGDYDNLIGGNWDLPIPEDFLNNFDDMPYYKKEG